MIFFTSVLHHLSLPSKSLKRDLFLNKTPYLNQHKAMLYLAQQEQLIYFGNRDENELADGIELGIECFMVDIPLNDSLQLFEQNLVEVIELDDWKLPQRFPGLFIHLAEIFDGWQDELGCCSKEFLHEGEVL